MSTISHDGAARALTPGKTIFDYADELAVEVPTSCRRRGTCHECVVEITEGMAALSAPREAESFLRGGEETTFCNFAQGLLRYFREPPGKTA